MARKDRIPVVFDTNVLAGKLLSNRPVKLQPRGEFFNIFNHANFRIMSSSVAAANYGQVTTVRDPRTIQIGAKLSF